MQTKRKQNPRFSRQVFSGNQGFTLMEIMIVGAISIFVMMGMYIVFEAQNQATIRTDDKRDWVGSLNTSFNLVTKHIRMAGFGVNLEGSLSPINNFNVTGGTPISDFNGSTLKTPLTAGNESQKIKDGTDAILILYKDNACKDANFVDNSGLFTNGNGSGAKICEPNCFSLGEYTANDVFLVEGLNGAIFTKVSNIQLAQSTSGCAGAPYTLLDFSDVDELNLTIRNRIAPGNPGVNQGLVRLETAFLYYVNEEDTLARLPLDTVFANEFVADSIDDLQIRYEAVATCDTAFWTDGCAASDAPAVPTPSSNIADIRAARLGLVMRASNEDKTTFLDKGLAKQLFDNDISGATADSYRRWVVSQLVRVKNLEIQDL